MGNEYEHNHRLVHMITGQWGEEISTTTTGTFVDKIYTYSIPENYKEIEADLGNMEIVAFISETHQEIANGSGCRPTFSNLEYSNDAQLVGVEMPNFCGTSIIPSVEITNNGSNEITSLAFEYSINDGETMTYDWSGSITSLNSEEISLNEIGFSVEETNSITISIETDEDDSNNSKTVEFDQYPIISHIVYLDLLTDKYGSEIRWKVLDKDGEVLYSGGPYSDAITQINKTFDLTEACYSFTITDSYGDGLNDGTNTGHVYLKDDQDVVILSYPNGKIGPSVDVSFATISATGINDINKIEISVYPNPVLDVLTIENAINSNVKIFNLLGTLVLSKNNIDKKQTIDVSNLKNGTYFVEISSKNSIKTTKIIITK